MRPVVSKLSNALRTGAAMVSLLALLAGQSQLVGGILALTAFAEGSHTVYAGGTAPGECKVVLSHERGQPGRKNYKPSHSPLNGGHHHGLASSLVCTLAGGVHQLADHVATISGSSTSESTERAKLKPRIATTAPAFAVPASFQAAFLPASAKADSRLGQIGSYPPAPHLAASTVLLI